METLTKIYVRVFSEEFWFGAWAPIDALPQEGEEAVFIIAENNLSEEDEYEFFRPGTVVRAEKMLSEDGEAFWGVREEWLETKEG